jgi:hypothetical protein
MAEGLDYGTLLAWFRNSAAETGVPSIFRNITGKTTTDHVRNRDIRHQCGIQEVAE